MAELCSGFVYVLTNDAMLGLVKVGRSINHPDYRARELSQGTAVPKPFRVAAFWLCDDASADEHASHQHLSTYRTAENREFFAVKAVDAIRLMTDALGRSPIFLDVQYAAKPIDPRKLEMWSQYYNFALREGISYQQLFEEYTQRFGYLPDTLPGMPKEKKNWDKQIGTVPKDECY